MSFNRVKKLRIAPEQTSPCDVPELGPDAVLHLAYAGEVNKEYFNARFGEGIAAAEKAAERPSRARKALKEIVKKEGNTKAARERDRTLFAQYIVKGWTDVLDDDDAKPPYTVEDMQTIIDDLCSDPSTVPIFDRIRGHANDPLNYREMPGDLNETAKNS